MLSVHVVALVTLTLATKVVPALCAPGDFDFPPAVSQTGYRISPIAAESPQTATQTAAVTSTVVGDAFGAALYLLAPPDAAPADELVVDTVSMEVNPLLGEFCTSLSVLNVTSKFGVVLSQWVCRNALSGTEVVCDCNWPGGVGLGPAVPDTCSCHNMLAVAAGRQQVDLRVHPPTAQKPVLLGVAGNLWSLPSPGDCRSQNVTREQSSSSPEHDWYAPRCAWSVSRINNSLLNASCLRARVLDSFLNGSVAQNFSECTLSCASGVSGCWVRCVATALYQVSTEVSPQSFRTAFIAAWDRAITDPSQPCATTIGAHGFGPAQSPVPTTISVAALRITRPGVDGVANKDTADISGDLFFGLFEVSLGHYGQGFLPYLVNGTAEYEQSTLVVNPLTGPYAMCNPTSTSDPNSPFLCRPEWNCNCSDLTPSNTSGAALALVSPRNETAACVCSTWGGSCGQFCPPTPLGAAFGVASVLSQWGNLEPGAGPVQPNCSNLTPPKCIVTRGCAMRRGVCGIGFDNQISLARLADGLRGNWFSTPTHGNCAHAPSTLDAPCTWREQPSSTRRFNATCANLKVAEKIWATAQPAGVGQSCLAQLDPADRLPFRPEWTRCLVQAALGDLDGQTAGVPPGVMTAALEDGLAACQLAKYR